MDNHKRLFIIIIVTLVGIMCVVGVTKNQKGKKVKKETIKNIIEVASLETNNEISYGEYIDTDTSVINFSNGDMLTTSIDVNEERKTGKYEIIYNTKTLESKDNILKIFSNIIGDTDNNGIIMDVLKDNVYELEKENSRRKTYGVNMEETEYIKTSNNPFDLATNIITYTNHTIDGYEMRVKVNFMYIRPRGYSEPVSMDNNIL